MLAARMRPVPITALSLCNGMGMTTAEIVDEIAVVSAAEAMGMARRLASEEGLFGGASSGANVVAALRVAERLGPEATVATLMIDSGIKYLSTDVYRSSAPAPVTAG